MVLHLRQEAPGQWDGAKCRGTVLKREDRDLFFDGPEDEAVAFCRAPEFTCPLLRGCLIFALVNNEKSGTWGGTGETDRRAIRKQWPLRRGKEPRPEWDLFEPGEPASWFSPDELDPEEDDDDSTG